MLWPPDGLNLKQGTTGELFGYGYLPLPLTAAKKTTAGKDVPTGNQCWTLFLNTGNFKGPVTFFLPYFWSKPTVEKPELGGLFLDTRPSEPNKAVQMETQHVPAYTGHGREGRHLRPRRPHPVPGEGGRRRPAHPPHHRVQQGGAVGRRGGVVRRREGGDRRDRPEGVRPSTRSRAGAGRPGRFTRPNTPREKKVPVAWSSFATPTALDDTTYGYKWAKDAVSKDGALVTLPEYYRLEKDAKGKEQWVVVSAKDVPAETGLAKVEFPKRRGRRPEALRHARRGGQLLEEAGAGGRAVRGEAGGRQRRHLLLVSVRRPARPAERRPDRRRAGGAPEAGGDAAREVDEGPRVPSARRRSASSPISTRRSS